MESFLAQTYFFFPCKHASLDTPNLLSGPKFNVVVHASVVKLLDLIAVEYFRSQGCSRAKELRWDSVFDQLLQIFLEFLDDHSAASLDFLADPVLKLPDFEDALALNTLVLYAEA